MNEYPLLVRNTFKLVFIFLVVAALIIARQLLVPLFLSVMIAYLLYPAANWLEEKGITRILTNFIVIVGAILIVTGSIYGLVILYKGFAQDLPDLKSQFETNLERFKQTLAISLGISEQSVNEAWKNFSSSGEYLSEALTATTRTIVNIGLLPVYTFLILFYRDKFREFVSMQIKSDKEETAQNIINQASHIVPKYLKGLILVCVILVGLNSTGLYLIGVEFPLLLGIIAALFNLIPYLGTVLGFGFVFLFVLGTQDPTTALSVVGLFFVIQFIENNILTPNITGSYVNINPLVIIPSLIAAGMIWGLPGMLIIIPYIGLFKIVCENIEDLKPIGFLIGTRGTKRHSITIKSLQKKFGWIDNE